jgi:hypothetical protein
MASENPSDGYTSDDEAAREAEFEQIMARSEDVQRRADAVDDEGGTSDRGRRALAIEHGVDEPTSGLLLPGRCTTEPARRPPPPRARRAVPAPVLRLTRATAGTVERRVRRLQRRPVRYRRPRRRSLDRARHAPGRADGHPCHGSPRQCDWDQHSSDRRRQDRRDLEQLRRRRGAAPARRDLGDHAGGLRPRSRFLDTTKPPANLASDLAVAAATRRTRASRVQRRDARLGRRAGAHRETPASRQRSCLGALVPPSARCRDGRNRAAADTRRGARCPLLL